MQATSWSFLIAAPVVAAAVVVPVFPWADECAETPAALEARAPAAPVAAAPPVPDAGAVMPQYDATRALKLPDDYLEWVFIGASLGLSYDASAGDHEMFNETLMEPTAYRHFVKTGEFREGTMFVLMLHGSERAVLPGRRGQFAGEVHGVEMAVKDRTRTPEGWAYYGFGGMGGATAKTSQPAPAGQGSCFACHKAHAARDNVFLQFYPLLAKAAGVKVETRRAPAPKP